MSGREDKEKRVREGKDKIIGKEHILHVYLDVDCVIQLPTHVYLTNLPLDIYFLFIFTMLAKFPKDKKSIVMSSIKYLNFKIL